MKYLRVFLIAVFLLNIEGMPTLQAQSYVGEILLRNTYQYIKLQVKDGQAKFSAPYLDGNRKYSVIGDWKGTQPWKVKRGVEVWKFKTTLKDNQILGKVTLPTGSQPVVLRKQLPRLAVSVLSQYAGVYADPQGRRVVIYHNSDYLHLMSPYSEESVSLKPISPQAFWSVSGEQTRFSDLQTGKYQQLQLTDRLGKKRLLKRSHAIKIEEVWIPVGQDTLYAKIFLPQLKTKVPACLVLPGGGSVGIANYMYEARFFAAYGIASLVFNKSGEGKSKGDGNFRRMTFEEKNKQYCELFKYLQNRPEVNAQKVGVHGPSEGGRLALLMAIDMPEVAFVNAVAAPLMTLREGQLYAVDHYLRNLGIDEEHILKARKTWNRYYEEIIAGKISEQTIKDANSLRGLHRRMFLPPNSANIPAAPSAKDLQNDRVVKEAGKIKCPVLMQYGENDQRVNPYKSLRNYRKQANPKTPLKVILYPRGSHSMMTPEFRICIGYTHDKIKWLRQIGIL